MATTKESILAEIERTASENGGVPLGQRAFESATGISVGVWRGRYWRTWSEAVIDAGLIPNVRAEPHDRKYMLASLALLTRKNGRFPTYADVRMERQVNESFPGHEALGRLGTMEERVELLRDLASGNAEYQDILKFLPEAKAVETAEDLDSNSLLNGFVYLGLLKVGREKRYKIGKTNLVERRTDQISVQLPEDLELVHAIRTDDATGIEAYWHRRFAAKRTKGDGSTCRAMT